MELNLNNNKLILRMIKNYLIRINNYHYHHHHHQHHHMDKNRIFNGKFLSTTTTTTTTIRANKIRWHAGYHHYCSNGSGINNSYLNQSSNAIFNRMFYFFNRTFFNNHFISQHRQILFNSIKSITTTTKMSDEKTKAQSAKDNGEETIFGKMLNGKIPAKFIFEDDLCVAFDDINPVAPVHFLVIPRKPITQLSKSTDDDEKILGHMMCVARKVAEQKGLASNGYRLVMNNGRHGCQSVYYIHLHVIGGKQLGWPPC